MRRGKFVWFWAVWGRFPVSKKYSRCLIDRRLTSFREGDLAANHIANARTNVVMHSQVGVWGKRNFGELAICTYR